MRLTIFGPPGSGKGTYAKMLGKTFRVPVISIGDLLREEVENKSEVGLKIKNLMKKGELVPDGVVTKIVKTKVGSEKNIVFDGFPRNMRQLAIGVDKAISLICSDKICIDRITSRLTCSKCKKIYNLITVPPNKKGFCDICKGKLVSRSDKQAVKGRLRVFKRETLPVINYFKKNKKLAEVDAERAISDVYKDIRKLFKVEE